MRKEWTTSRSDPVDCVFLRRNNKEQSCTHLKVLSLFSSISSSTLFEPNIASYRIVSNSRRIYRRRRPRHRANSWATTETLVIDSKRGRKEADRKWEERYSFCSTDNGSLFSAGRRSKKKKKASGSQHNPPAAREEETKERAQERISDSGREGETRTKTGAFNRCCTFYYYLYYIYIIHIAAGGFKPRYLFIFMN